MDYQVLETDYLETNHIDSLRFQLCEILYEDYKGTTFFLTHQLEQKKRTFNKLSEFIKDNPDIYNYKNNSSYYYPYSNVEEYHNKSLYGDSYFNKDGGLTYFGKVEINSIDTDVKIDVDAQDYLFDPLKLQFFLMAGDISKMDYGTDISKEIMLYNNKIFAVILDAVGDTISYDNFNTMEHIDKYLQDHLQAQSEAENDASHSQDYRDYLVRQYGRFNDYSYLLNDAVSMLRQYKLDNKLEHKKDNNTVKKI